MDVVELLVGIAEIAVALAGFTGIVVAFGSRSQGTWHPGDRLRLVFLLEASLTAAAFALLGLLAVFSGIDHAVAWAVLSGMWATFMVWSLLASRKRINTNSDDHGDVDRLANRITGSLFVLLVIIQVGNVVLWQEFYPFLAAVMLNLAGAAMQFARLIRSAFHE